MSEMKFPVKGMYRALLINKKLMAYNNCEGCYCLIGSDDIWISAREVLGKLLKYGNKIYARITIDNNGMYKIIRINND